jgi:hypothetical protein
MNDTTRFREELWRMELGGEPWSCQLKTEEGRFEATVLRGGTPVSRRRFDRRELATWWATLERIDLVA